MSQEIFFRKIVDCLNAAQIPFMVCGSLASSAYGQPRTTQDIDFVIAPAPETLTAFLQLTPTEYYVSREAANQALVQRSMFNVIDPESGWKADLIILKDQPFDLEEFRRRQTVTLLETSAPMVTPEDAILSKLLWAKDSQSESQFRDVLGIVLVRRKSLDQDYLTRWARELDISNSLSRVMDEADRISK